MEKMIGGNYQGGKIPVGCQTLFSDYIKVD
jgi:hypothetical protein